MRIFQTSIFAVLLCFGAGPVLAANAQELSGTAVLLPSGVLMIDGRDVALWGIDPLANDQQCWHEGRAWDCGEQALMALRYNLAGHSVRCDVKSAAGGNKMIAQCFRMTGGKEDDIGHDLVNEGWARDRVVDSGGLYAQDQEDARLHARGIWTSRFQSAEDWKNGIPNYVQYQPAPAKSAAAQVSSAPAGTKNAPR